MPNSKKNRNFAHFFKVIFVLLFVFYIAWILFFSQYGKYNTILALTGSLEDKIDSTGYIVHDSSLVYGGDANTVTFIAKEGERVTKNSKLATVFSEKVPEEIQIKLIRINEKIIEKKNALSDRVYFSGTSYYAEYQVLDNVKKIISVINGNKELYKIPDYKNNISKTVNQGYGGSTSGESIEQLESKREDIENSVSGEKRDVFSSRSGVFTSKVDEYDEFFNVDSLKNVTPDFLENINLKSKSSGELPIAKIINNYEWYFVTVVSEGVTADLKVGMSLAVRFPGISSDSYSAVLDSVSVSQNGKVALVLKCDGDISVLIGKRNLQAEIIKSTYSGFKIPKSVISVVSEKEGVFVLEENVAEFKPVTILGGDDKFVIVESNSKENSDNKLLLYDEIIVDSKNLYDGKVLN